MITRRDFLTLSAQAGFLLGASPITTAFVSLAASGRRDTVRCINVVNFIRGVEPREPMDLLLPVQRQMDLSLKYQLPTTWLLQFDALIAGPFVHEIKSRMAPNHEVGFWFEMNEMLCRHAKVEWRGRSGYEWDYNPSVAFSIGYTKEERIKLIDAAMFSFQSTFGHYPRSVASWNLDAISMTYLSEQYGVDAFAVCRDQIATDGFTIWGAPIAGYYPSKVNCWSPGTSRESQIGTPVFRMLGQDPVYYYYREFPAPGGRRIHPPDTMEPVWGAGRDPKFVETFYKMITHGPSLGFAYAQIGQENSFGWPSMEPGLPQQLEALAKIRDLGLANVETLGETGRRFKERFKVTPAQTQIMLDDPFGNSDPAESTIWYQSRYYRANLHIRGDLPFLRDVTVYSDRNEQPFLRIPTRLSDVEQRMPAVMDGYHWSSRPGALGEPGAGAFLTVNGKRVRTKGKPTVKQAGDSLYVRLPTEFGLITITFTEIEIRVALGGKHPKEVGLSFEWDGSKAPIPTLSREAVHYEQTPGYEVRVLQGVAQVSEVGWKVSSQAGLIRLGLSQST